MRDDEAAPTSKRALQAVRLIAEHAVERAKLDVSLAADLGALFEEHFAEDDGFDKLNAIRSELELVRL